MVTKVLRSVTPYGVTLGHISNVGIRLVMLGNELDCHLTLSIRKLENARGSKEKQTPKFSRQL